MKQSIDGFLIVEGIADKAFLSSFLNCEIICMGGYDMPRGTLDYISQLSRVSQPIILTDQDEAGRIIAKRLKNVFPNAFNALVVFKNRKNYQKDGIAETSKESVLNALRPFIIDTEKFSFQLTSKDLVDLGLFDVKKRKYLQNRLKIGNCNFKTTIRRLNYLKYTKKDIERAMTDYDYR